MWLALMSDLDVRKSKMTEKYRAWTDTVRSFLSARL